jgi:hypothetical protein
VILVEAFYSGTLSFRYRYSRWPLRNSAPGLSFKAVVIAIAESNNARNGFAAP